MPILITAGSYAEAYRLKRILGVEEVIFGDEMSLPSIPDIKNLVIPTYAAASFVHEILKACLDLNISQVYPLRRGEVLELSKARALFTEYNVKLMIPSDDWIKKNAKVVSPNSENICVLDQGLHVAGNKMPENNLIENENGVFTWVTLDLKIEFSLYLV